MKKIKLDGSKLELMKQRIVSLSADQQAQIQGGSDNSGNPRIATCHYPPTYFCIGNPTQDCPATEVSVCDPGAGGCNDTLDDGC
jgi:hypothetical protein